MANNLGVYIEQNSNLIISPQIYQAMEIIQLTLPELVDYINNELLENPLIEVVGDCDNDYEKEKDPLGEEIKGPEKDGQWLDSIGEVLLEDRDNWFLYDKNEDEQITAEGQWLDNNSLEEYLMEQLRFLEHSSHLSRQEFAIAQFLIGNLNSNGYLTISIEETAAILRLPRKEVLKALKILQQLDPPGIGARNLHECLKLQISLLPDCPPKMEFLLDYLDDLAVGHFNKIAQALEISSQEVMKMGKSLKLIDPKPGSRFGRAIETKYIIPDAFIKKIGNEYYVLVNESNIPKICINEKYRKVLSKQDNYDIKKFVREKVNSGLNLIKCIENRRLTIHAVLEVVARRQKEFLDQGAAVLKPLTMKEVAEEVGLHESTVSRVSANKYIDTPRGLFPIKCFFAGSVGKVRDVTAAKIKDSLKKYISAEDFFSPYSDQELADILGKQGIEIARRTIAKYRGELGIPSSHLRQKSKFKK